jgi:hypothetical protein
MIFHHGFVLTHSFKELSSIVPRVSASLNRSAAASLSRFVEQTAAAPWVCGVGFAEPLDQGSSPSLYK